MTKPRVVGSTRRDPLRRPPPREISAHPWFADDTAQLYGEALARDARFGLYMSTLAEGKIRAQSLAAAPASFEVMGLLLGEVCSWEDRTYSIIRDVGTTNLRNSPAKVKFDPDSLPRLFNDMDHVGFDYVVIGWYHSHPGHTCFMSRVDLLTQRKIFREDYHCSVVIDPINEEIRAFKLTSDGYAELPFALISPEALRLRRLRMVTNVDC